ncbi:hypothetical protein DUNSADRAFT_15006 [Dunaliella salina]|uniref:Secreted protein n=1 Tax=Dunaliella salina TaxID=3046 RepID=A0ABQ7G686_DUNSA|nr:hypothetical protein DUNSADRAFT_15006 [Dunaliella salina]|eukprot:KAF5830115.1 hypothetical protein DUNSADRAFT_15006 [Dunaliella salina]
MAVYYLYLCMLFAVHCFCLWVSCSMQPTRRASSDEAIPLLENTPVWLFIIFTRHVRCVPCSQAVHSSFDLCHSENTCASPVCYFLST